MKCYFFFFAVFLLLGLAADAQDFEYGKISNADVNLKKVALDSNANAVVIREFGTTRKPTDDDAGTLLVNFKYHVKIKILNKEGFKHGTIVIPRRIYREDEEEISDLTATTYNYSNGKLEKFELERKNIFHEKVGSYAKLTKFTMPNLKEGSIIEYSYTLTIPYIHNFRSWEFQSDIPKLYSEYLTYIPVLYNYNASIRGVLKMTSSKVELVKACFYQSGRPFDCAVATHIMKDIPAFAEEEYMTAASNFRSAIYYELSDYLIENGARKSVSQTWNDVDDELMEHRFFGAQMKQKSVFERLLPGILKHATDSLSKAEAIYDYIAKNIKSNHIGGIVAEKGIKKALELHTGNTGDINLALVTALLAADLDAEALILSTRDNGTVGSLYPVINDFNYVVAKLNIGGSSYLLDASQPFLPFGLLPLHCINGKGRAFTFKKPSYWYDIRSSQRDMTMYDLQGEFNPDGKIKGVLTVTSTGYAALNKRNQIAVSNSVGEYVEKIDEGMPSIQILKHQVLNTDSLNEPLKEIYEIEMKAFDKMNAEQLFYNPFFIERMTKNPFNLNERTYPVDFGSTREVRIAARVKMPPGFSIAEKPKDLSISLLGSGGKYLFKSAEEDGSLVYSQLFQLTKPVYGRGEYLSLKEFYSRIIQLQKTEMVFKKSK